MFCGRGILRNTFPDDFEVVLLGPGLQIVVIERDGGHDQLRRRSGAGRSPGDFVESPQRGVELHDAVPFDGLDERAVD